MATEGSVLQKAQSDPNVVVPPAVKRAAQRSEELSAQAKVMREARPPGSDDPVRIANPPPSAPNPATGVVTAAFDPQNPNPPDLTINSQPPQTSDAPNWEHQFNSMKGRYDRTEADNRRMAAQITDMQRLLAAMPVNQPAPVPPQQGSGVQFTGGISGNAPRQPQRRVSPKEVEMPWATVKTCDASSQNCGVSIAPTSPLKR